MHSKRTQGIIAMCLTIAAVLSIGATGITRQTAAAADPFSEMRDEYLVTSSRSRPADISRDALKKEAIGRTGAPPDETDPDAAKTDRYIVKLKEGREAVFEQKIATRLAASLDITPEVRGDTGTFSVRGAGGTGAKHGISVDAARETIEIPIVSMTAKNTKLIILSEPMLPSELAAELKASGAGNDIEYIQPDFELSLDGLGLELIDDGNGLTEEPEETVTADDQTEPEQEEAPDEDDAQNMEDAGEPEDGKDLESSEEPEDGEEPEVGEEPEDDGDLEDGEEPEGSEEEEEIAEGAEPVLVAVIDTGVDTGHEIFDGYLHEDAPDTDTALLSYAHGTHVSGIIVNTAAESNAGIKILPIRVFDNGNAYTSDIIAAVYYATARGAKVINCSFGSTAYNQALYEAIAESGALFVCAAGNNRRDFDAMPSYPAGYGLPNIISVASTNYDDGASYYTNYGQNSIDIAARGRDVYSSLPGNSYGAQSGTSMSAAYVTGVAASVLAQEELSAGELKSRLIESADMLSNLQNKVADGRRVNLGNALSGAPGQYLALNPEEDFDVHGYQRTDEENWQLFSSLEITQVSAGEYHSLALASDGTVWAFGRNNNGQLGDGGLAPQEETPVQVLGLTDVIAIAAGENHNLALKSNGTVWSWGYNPFGQLGDGTNYYKNTPVQVIGLTNVIAISAGKDHSLAVKSDGTAWGWGANWYGQLGADSNYVFDSNTPLQVNGITGVITVAAGEMYSLALKNDGKVWAWGVNWFGQLGDNSGIDSYMPVQVIGLTNVTAISAGQYHGLAIKVDGSVWGWGVNWYGQLGVDGNNLYESYVPIQILGITNVISISAGSSHNLAIKSDGTAWGWGSNNCGELGNGTYDSSYTPVQVANLMDVIDVAVGDYHSLAIEGDGAVWSWGLNWYGQLGNGGWSDSDIPMLVSSFTGDGPIDAELSFSIVYGEQTIIALTATDVTTFYNQAITVTYDPAELQLLDAAYQVYGTYIATGSVPGTEINITAISSGTLTLTFDTYIPPGKSWSGVITIMRFSAIATGITNVTVSM